MSEIQNQSKLALTLQFLAAWGGYAGVVIVSFQGFSLRITVLFGVIGLTLGYMKCCTFSSLAHLSTGLLQIWDSDTSLCASVLVGGFYPVYGSTYIVQPDWIILGRKTADYWDHLHVWARAHLSLAAIFGSLAAPCTVAFARDLKSWL